MSSLADSKALNIPDSDVSDTGICHPDRMGFITGIVDMPLGDLHPGIPEDPPPGNTHGIRGV